MSNTNEISEAPTLRELTSEELSSVAGGLLDLSLGLVLNLLGLLNVSVDANVSV